MAVQVRLDKMELSAFLELVAQVHLIPLLARQFVTLGEVEAVRLIKEQL